MTYYLKSAAWFLRGYYNFTHSGFIRSSQHFNPVNEISTKGLSFMVTGGSTGIGRNVALQLAKRPGTTVHIVCKNSQNGKEAIEFIRNDCHETSELCLHLVDLSEPTEVINFARQIVENKIKINILINNAGILNNDAQLTTQGYERSFSLNVLGTYLLTVSLAPHILKWSKTVCYPRIITVSSGGMLTEPLNTDCYTYGKNHFDGVSAYAQHKRQQLVFMDVLSDQYPDIKFSTMHPGWVNTPGVQNSLPTFYAKFKHNLRTPEEGADTIIWLALSTEALSFKSGTFFFDRKPAKRFLISDNERYDESTENIYMANLNKYASNFIDINQSSLS